MKRVLVTGALGQIGSELVPALRARYGGEVVVGSDIRMPPAGAIEAGPFEFLDCTNGHMVQEIVRKHEVGTIYHLAALLSATAEQKPHIAWDLNMGGLYQVLEVGRQHRCQVFFPSSIGAFGPGTPPDRTPQDTVQLRHHVRVTKVAASWLCDYYFPAFLGSTPRLALSRLFPTRAPARRRHHRLASRSSIRRCPASATVASCAPTPAWT